MARINLAAWIVMAAVSSGEPGTGRPYGLDARPKSPTRLNFPLAEGGSPPTVLSRTGAFADTRSLVPGPGMIPYEVNAPFWSDGALKRRWIAMPGRRDGELSRIQYTPTGEWRFPKGTVFVKHFELAPDEARPEVRRRLETRLLVCDGAGGVQGVSYRWRPDDTDADLVKEACRDRVTIRTSAGTRAQDWYFPDPADCRQCHTPSVGGVLGVNTRQLNGDLTYPTGITDNQLRTWNHLGLFEPGLDERDLPRLGRLARLDEGTISLEDRARSFLDANCSQCHRPNGVAADFDARYETPMPRQGLIGVPARIDFGVDGAKLIAPNDPWRSTILTRVETLEPIKMPPLAHEVIDRQAVALLRSWIETLPGPPVVAPPAIEPRSGDYRGPVRVIIAHSDPLATIRYTLDGTAPGKSSSVYTGPFEIRRSSTVRARAYKPGSTRSITVQETLIIAR